MRAPIDRPSLAWRAFVIGGVGTMKALSFSDRAWAWWEDNVTDAIPRSVVRGALAGTVATHAIEATIVWRRVTAAELPHAGSWVFTTFVYGFPEIRRANRAIRRQAAGD